MLTASETRATKTLKRSQNTQTDTRSILTLLRKRMAYARGNQKNTSLPHKKCEKIKRLSPYNNGVFLSRKGQGVVCSLGGGAEKRECMGLFSR
jgi:hypothetical protein